MDFDLPTYKSHLDNCNCFYLYYLTRQPELYYQQSRKLGL